MAQGLLNVPAEYSYDPLIRQWADQYGIPFALAKGLVSVESRFDANAWRAEPHLGPTEGSRGLMQILERTAKGVGFAGDPRGLFDPNINLRYGLKFFAELLSKPTYSVADAIASYNMGSPRPAAKTTPLITRLYGAPKPDWVYANEPYVRRVLMNAAFYLAEEQGNAAAMEAIRGIVKKKRLPIPVQSWSWTLESTLGRRRITCATFDFHLLSRICAELDNPSSPPPA